MQEFLSRAVSLWTSVASVRHAAADKGRTGETPRSPAPLPITHTRVMRSEKFGPCLRHRDDPAFAPALPDCR